MNGYCTQIEKHLYLADIMAATSSSLIQRLKVKHIITCNTKPLEQPLVKNYLWIDSEDMPRQDLISHFEETFQFIQRAVDKNQSVLIHCIAGVSRSATIVTAYLMKKHKKTADECLDKVRKERPIVDPNEGFRRQLKLYETMGYKIDVLNKDYRIIAMDHMVSRLSRKHYAVDGEKGDAALAIFRLYLYRLSQTENLHEPQIVYKCKKCRTQLFADINVISSNQSDQCKSIYIEPLIWMEDVLKELTVSDINCPQCTKKIGYFDLNGINCDIKCLQHTDFKGVFKINANDVDAHNLKIDQMVFKSLTYLN